MALNSVLDFEKPLAELDAAIDELKRISEEEGIDRAEEISALQEHRDRLAEEIFSNLSPWDKTLLARHPNRPYALDYIRAIFDDFVELHGDRLFADDKAMIGGFAILDGKPVLVVGQQKGRDLKERQFRNFGSAKPEGYRKALRLMKMAEKFNRPIICIVDTPAADCSFGAEERGISEAIARNMMEMAVLGVPIVVVIVGEGGSGGALGIAVGNRVLMQEHAIYSVIPPEGCAAILSEFDRNPARAPEARRCPEHHRSAQPRTRDHRRDHPRAEGRRASELRAGRRRREGSRRPPPRGASEDEPREADRAAIPDVPRHGRLRDRVYRG